MVLLLYVYPRLQFEKLEELLKSENPPNPKMINGTLHYLVKNTLVKHDPDEVIKATKLLIEKGAADVLYELNNYTVLESFEKYNEAHIIEHHNKLHLLLKEVDSLARQNKPTTNIDDMITKIHSSTNDNSKDIMLKPKPHNWEELSMDVWYSINPLNLEELRNTLAIQGCDPDIWKNPKQASITPLHYLVKNTIKSISSSYDEIIEAAKLLIEKGANVLYKVDTKYTVLECFEKYNKDNLEKYKELHDILKEADALARQNLLMINH